MRDQLTSELAETLNAHSQQRLVRGHLSATLYLGDCLEIALTLQGVDAVITDPPYGIGFVSPKSRAENNGLKHKITEAMANRNAGESIIGDDNPFNPAPWLQYPIVLMWGANNYARSLPDGGWLAWDKMGGRESIGDYFSDFEVAWKKEKTPGRIFRHLWKGLHKKRMGEDEYGLRGANTPRLHVSQKPVLLMAWCLEQAKVPAGATVLDPYMGSGTTGIACLRTGRNFVGIERDPKHFATAVARLEREANQGALL